MNTRYATSKDIPELVRVINLAYRVEDFFIDGDRTNAAEIKSRMEAPGACFIVVDSDDAQALAAAGLAGPGNVRVNKAGCLDRCAGGPIAVVYPEEVWYTYVDEQDIDEIVESHLKNGKVVERLLTPPHLGR